ncbi:class I SAM-dependent methyltransferase [Jannaschia sp. 2305UL9-9]|uniref:class I SAM-dependent DNA methyltransferase n=1 Tax=Jannaschia sp. 2305UL9-9 TaxID=3121638 RepID=UPI0035285E77
MTGRPMKPGLWAPRSVEETRRIYADWADTYEEDVNAAGYVTPARVASALRAHLPDTTTPVLDFGCGTGLSGAALQAEGFATVDGTDISPEMLEQARTKGLYRNLVIGDPEAPPQVAGYGAVIATGVISLGAAPADMLDAVLTQLTRGALLVFSYNDATLVTSDYLDAVAQVQADGLARLLWAEYGPHLPRTEGAMGSTVYVLSRL